MKTKLINTLAQDLNIVKSDSESESSFNARLIYSAMTDWIRYSVLDKTAENPEIKSKVYLRHRGTEILNAYLQIFPECKYYFFLDENDEHPIRFLREQLLHSGELIQVEKGIVLPKAKEVQINDSISKIIGFTNDKFTHYGLSRIKYSNKDAQYENSMVNSDEWFSNLTKKSKWEEINELTDFEIFDYSLVYPPYKCWRKETKLVGDYVTLARIKVFDYDYYLLKKKNGKYYISKMNSYLKQFAEYRRLISLLKFRNGNPIKANAVVFNHYVELQMHARLPKVEENLILEFCWPKRNINDKFYFLVPLPMWNYFKEVLENLKIQVQEDVYGKL